MKLLFIFWLWLFLIPSFSYAMVSDSKEPIFMAVVGDSAALGVWADSKIGNPGPNFYITAATIKIESTIFASFFGVKANDLENAEKYSNTVDTYFNYVERKRYSSLLGSQHYSLMERIKDTTGKEVELVDASFLAGSYRLAPNHLKQFRQFMQKHPGHKDPDFIFINFSAMDFMFNSSLERFENDLRTFYTQLTKEYPHSTIVANTLVDIVTLMHESMDKIAVPIFNNPLLKSQTCADNYNNIGFGVIIGMTKGVTDEHLIELHVKLNAMNEILTTELANIETHQYPYQDFTGKVIQIPPYQPLSGYWPEYLAADCIHPNLLGQQGYSTIIWDALSPAL